LVDNIRREWWPEIGTSDSSFCLGRGRWRWGKKIQETPAAGYLFNLKDVYEPELSPAQVPYYIGLRRIFNPAQIKKTFFFFPFAIRMKNLSFCLFWLVLFILFIYILIEVQYLSSWHCLLIFMILIRNSIWYYIYILIEVQYLSSWHCLLIFMILIRNSIWYFW
jgi:hypothetical protein